jgi:hypothetical protein
MTTGTSVNDDRVWHPAEGFGPYLTGVYSYKTWAGGDSERQLWQQYVFLPYWKKDGTVRYSKRKLWARPPKRSRNDEHNYRCVWERFSNPRVALRWNLQGSFTWGGFHELFSSGNFPDRWTELDDLAVLTRLRTKIAGSTYNAAVSIAELRETLEFIGGTASRINTAVGAMKKGQYAQAYRVMVGGKQGPVKGWNALRAPKTMAKANVVYNYAIRPALQDVKLAAEYLAQSLNFPLQTTVRVSKHKRCDLPPANLDQSIRPTLYNVRLRQGLIARIVEVDVPQLLGLTDPLTVAHEKIPYSFMVDWFIPVGEWLSARGLAQAITGRFIKSTRESFSWWGATSADPNLELTGAEGWSYSTGIFERTVSDYLDVPTIAFKPLSSIASWHHATNAISLLLNAHGSGFRPHA